MAFSIQTSDVPLRAYETTCASVVVTVVAIASGTSALPPSAWPDAPPPVPSATPSPPVPPPSLAPSFGARPPVAPTASPVPVAALPARPAALAPTSGPRPTSVACPLAPACPVGVLATEAVVEGSQWTAPPTSINHAARYVRLERRRCGAHCDDQAWNARRGMTLETARACGVIGRSIERNACAVETPPKSGLPRCHVVPNAVSARSRCHAARPTRRVGRLAGTRRRSSRLNGDASTLDGDERVPLGRS